MSSLLPPCPAAGTGVHSWLLAAANYCRIKGLDPAGSAALISREMTRPPSPPNEVESAVAKAFSADLPPQAPVFRASSVGKRSTGERRAVPLHKIQPRLDRLRQVGAKVTPQNWRHFLWERSPRRPDLVNALAFLQALFLPGEKILIFDKMETARARWTLELDNGNRCDVSADITGGGQGAGIWFLANPVDGLWHDTGLIDPETGRPRKSQRSASAVTSFRYAVLESDLVPAEDWIPFLVLLPARIAAVYTSGGRSVHALLRIDAETKDDWDVMIQPLKRPLKALGADPACLSAVRLTRLPGCHRPEKGGFQKLLYLNPNPPICPIIDLPVLDSRAGLLHRWRTSEPAFQ